MQKSILKIVGVIAAVIVVSGLITLKVLDNIKKFEEKNSIKKVQATAEEEKAEDQTKKIGGVQYDVGLNEYSQQEEVISVMHKMTHQKVKAKDKWGATPMIPETINTVLAIINASNFKLKSDLHDVVSGWQKGEFDNIVEDHNYLWGLQGGTIGQAYGTLNKTEEETFIINNFGDEVAQKWAAQ